MKNSDNNKDLALSWTDHCDYCPEECPQCGDWLSIFLGNDNMACAHCGWFPGLEDQQYKRPMSK